MMSQPPGTIPGGDGYNPWGASGPPPGAPQYIPPGGQVYTIDPNTGSPFIPQDGNIILVPVPANTAVNANIQPTPKGKQTPAPANTQPTPAPSETQKPLPASDA